MLKNSSVYVQNLVKRLLVILAIIIAILILYFISPYFAPFLIAIVVAFIIEPAVRFLVNKLKFNRKIASMLMMLIFYAIVGTALVLIISQLVEQTVSLGKSLPEFFNNFITTLTTWINETAENNEWLHGDITDKLLEFVAGLSASILDLINLLLKKAINTAVSVPESLIFLIATILSTYFFSSEKEKMFAFMRSQIPEEWQRYTRKVKKDLFLALFGYLRALIILMAITFLQLYLGFIILNVRFALSLAFLTSLIDALPVFGTGTVLLPWAGYNFLVGNNKFGLSLLILYLVVFIIRQIIEPKIIGKQLGVHPLLTLSGMFVGMKLIGVAGLIIGPITLVVIQSLLKTIFRNKPINPAAAATSRAMNRSTSNKNSRSSGKNGTVSPGSTITDRGTDAGKDKKPRVIGRKVTDTDKGSSPKGNTGTVLNGTEKSDNKSR